MDHYQIIGVGRDANEEQIKKAYRKLAMQYHPDRNPSDPDADKKFKEVQSAYDILSDTDKRRLYDMQTAPRQSASPPKPPSPPPKTKPSPKPKQEKKPKDPPKPPDLEDVQCTYFESPWSGRNVMVQVKLTPQQMRMGGVRHVNVKKRDMCQKCVGDGKAKGLCPSCRAIKPSVAWCPRCDGIGLIEITCPICNGEGVADWIVKSVKINVSPNVQPGHTIKVMGEGENAPNRSPGDLRVVIVPA